MLDLEAMISAQRLMCLYKYIEEYESPWKNALDFYLAPSPRSKWRSEKPLAKAAKVAPKVR